MQDGVVAVHLVGLDQAGSNRRAKALLPVRRGDRSDTGRGRDLSGAEHQNDVVAATAVERGHRGFQPAVDQHFRLAVPLARARGQ